MADQIRFIQSRKPNRTMIGYILDNVWFMMKMRQDNDMVDRIGLLYIENETKLS